MSKQRLPDFWRNRLWDKEFYRDFETCISLPATFIWAVSVLHIPRRAEREFLKLKREMIFASNSMIPACPAQVQPKMSP